jgi:hypothetical protein
VGAVSLVGLILVLPLVDTMPATLLGVCFAAFLAVTAGLLLQRPLPALPFIAIAFVLVNADLIVVSLAKWG